MSIEGPRRCLRRVAKAPPSLPELALYDAAVHHLTRISHMYMTYGETRRVRDTRGAGGARRHERLNCFSYTNYILW